MILWFMFRQPRFDWRGCRFVCERKMHMNKTERLAAFEAMLAAVQKDHAQANETMRRLREQGKEKTATYRQLLGNRMVYQNLLSLYRAYGLLEGEET